MWPRTTIPCYDDSRNTSYDKSSFCAASKSNREYCSQSNQLHVVSGVTTRDYHTIGIVLHTSFHDTCVQFFLSFFENHQREPQAIRKLRGPCENWLNSLPLTASLSPLRTIRQPLWLAAGHGTLDESRHDNAATTRQLNASIPKRRSPLNRDDGTPYGARSTRNVQDELNAKANSWPKFTNTSVFKNPLVFHPRMQLFRQRSRARGSNRSTVRLKAMTCFYFVLLLSRPSDNAGRQRRITVRCRRCESTSTLHERTKLSEHFYRTPWGRSSLPAEGGRPPSSNVKRPTTRPLPWNRVGTISDRCTALRTHREQSIGKRACHHFSRPIGRLARHGGGAIASWRHSVNMTDLSRRCFGSDVSFPSLASRPFPMLSSSSTLICSLTLRSVHKQRFYLLFRAAKSAARRTHVPLRGRSVEQRRCIRPRALICSFGHELELRDTLRTQRRQCTNKSNVYVWATRAMRKPDGNREIRYTNAESCAAAVKIKLEQVTAIPYSSYKD